MNFVKKVSDFDEESKRAAFVYRWAVGQPSSFRKSVMWSNFRRPETKHGAKFRVLCNMRSRLVLKDNCTCVSDLGEAGGIPTKSVSFQSIVS